MDLTKRITQLLLQIRDEPSYVSSADCDELVYLVDVSYLSFPDQFHEILKSMVRNWDPGGDTKWLKEQADRLIRLAEIHEKIAQSNLASRNKASWQDNAALIPLFSLAEKDVERVAKLCSKMRQIIFVTEEFDAPHRKRLLNRIAAIEAEIHKPEGMFDVVRAGLSDLGETLGKFGKDIKPLTDRMGEVVSIVRKGTKEYHQLPEPEDVKKLPAPKNSDGDT